MEQYLWLLGVVVGIAFVLFVGIEIVITMHNVRKNLSRITTTTCDTLDQVQPVVQKIDATLDDLAPSIARMDVLTQKSERTLDAINEELEVAHVILDNASEISKKTVGVSNALTSVAESTISGITGCASSVAKNFLKGYKTARRAVEEGAGLHELESDNNPYLFSQDSQAAYGAAGADAHAVSRTSSSSLERADSTPSSGAASAAVSAANRHLRSKHYITYDNQTKEEPRALNAQEDTQEHASQEAHAHEEDTTTRKESAGTTHASE